MLCRRCGARLRFIEDWTCLTCGHVDYGAGTYRAPEMSKHADKRLKRLLPGGRHHAPKPDA